MSIIKCQVCEVEFYVIPSLALKQKYCSRECMVIGKTIPILGGEIYNKLTIIKEIEPEIQYNKGKASPIRVVECLCECGNITKARWVMLRNWETKSCGCLTRKQAKINTDQTTHGLSKHPLYSIWGGMKQRCYEEQNKRYDRYGGRGIIICEEWVYDFKAFYDWAIYNGWRKGLTIERKDNDGDYEPSNCKWATTKEQCGNRVTSIRITYKGETMCLTGMCEKYGLSYCVMRKRIKDKGLSFEDALMTLKK